MRVIAIINQKGGVGKTTTVVNLGHALALTGKRVLMLDIDPQGHLTCSYGINPTQGSGMDTVLLDGQTLASQAQQVRENLFLVIAGSRLGDVEHKGSSTNIAGKLHEALTEIDAWDIVLIDCPPSSGLLVAMAIFAAKEALIPVTGDYFGMQGLSSLMATLKNYESKLQCSLKQRIVMTRYQTCRRLTHEVKHKLVNYFPSAVMQTPIREVVALATCPSFGQSIFEYDMKSNGAKDYRNLAQDLLHERVM